MTNLWVTAAFSEWWGARNRGDLTTMNRHRDQVAGAHGVKGFQAGIALRGIYQSMNGNRDISPKDAGFASGPKTGSDGNLEMAFPDDHDLYEHHRWNGIEPTEVNLKQPIHATQEGVTAPMVAHNLFHPGKLPPGGHSGPGSEHVGNPDFDPDDMDHGHRVDSVSADESSSVPRFYRDATGKMHVADGHHQVAAALLLKKPSIRGRVWDESNPPGAPR